MIWQTTPVTSGSRRVRRSQRAGEPRDLSTAALARRWSATTTRTPVIDIYGSTQDADLGLHLDAGQQDRRRHRRANCREAPRSIVRGQVETMTTSFNGLLFGLVGAIVLVYLLIVVNFQSWLDPFIIITALPAALAGIVWMLFLTHTTVSVPALTGAIMCMGVATANSVLVISFARERMNAGDDALTRRLEAGFARFRPGADDRAGDDHRHGADGAGPGRGRRAERAAGPRRDRRPDVRDGGDAVLRADRVRPHSRARVHKRTAA